MAFIFSRMKDIFEEKNSRLRLVIIILVFRKGFLSLILHHQSTLFSWFTFSHVVFVFVYVYLYICMSSSPSSCVLNICTFTMHIIWPLSYSFKLKHDMALYSVFKVIEIPKYLFLIFLSTINSFFLVIRIKKCKSKIFDIDSKLLLNSGMLSIIKFSRPWPLLFEKKNYMIWRKLIMGNLILCTLKKFEIWMMICMISVYSKRRGKNQRMTANLSMTKKISHVTMQ